MTDSSANAPLSPLQIDLIREFFAREQDFALTGGAALSGFYLHHRETKDLDLFGRPGSDIERAEHALGDAAQGLGASLQRIQSFAEFRRYAVERGNETTLVDLVIDRAAQVEPPQSFGATRVHSLREIAANKLCTVLSRAEPRDLVDLKLIFDTGVTLEQTLSDAALKDGGADAATLAWVVSEIRVGPAAVLPAGVSPMELEGFRSRLESGLRRLAYPAP
jgi:Nucleotidyl transferase AbiEii toxin, Type IV TA system